MQSIYSEPELKASSAVLKSSAVAIENICETSIKKFQKCKLESSNPFDCFYLANELLNCVHRLYEEIKEEEKCISDFDKLCKCIDRNNQDYLYCLNEEAQFLKCIKIDNPTATDKWNPLNSWNYRYHIWQQKQ